MSDNVQHFVVENNNNNNNIGLTLNDYACQMTIYLLEDIEHVGGSMTIIRPDNIYDIASNGISYLRPDAQKGNALHKIMHKFS